jgi:hypothetical protein
MRAGGALGEFPLVAEERLEVAHVPLGGVGLPCAFDAAGDGVASHAGAELVAPAQALLEDVGAFGLAADVAVGRGAVGLAEGVAAGNEGDGLFVVHRHAAEGLADVATGGHRIRIGVGALRVDVDQAHLHGAEGVGKHAVAGVAALRLVAGGEPCGLEAPVDLGLGLVDVGAAAAEAEGLEAHRLERDVAGEHQQIGPRQLGAVLLLDRPQQAARLVEVAVVGPAVQRREALVAGAGAAAAVADAVGARGVPGHADEERTVVAVVGRPPLLGIGHQGGKVLDHGVEVELLELGGVVEVLAHRVGRLRLQVQHREVELFGPPVTVAAAARGHGQGGRAARERALGFTGHA